MGCHFLFQCMKEKSESEVAQSCPTPNDPKDWQPTRLLCPWIFQARVLEWGAIAFSGDGHVHTVIFKWIKQQGSTAQQAELCSVLCGSLDGRGVWGRIDTCISMAESLCCASKTITWLIGYTPIKNKRLRKELCILGSRAENQFP